MQKQSTVGLTRKSKYTHQNGGTQFEMFAAIQGLSYSESIKYISPGSGLHKGMFSSLEHSQYYELDTRLTFKEYQKKKGPRWKTMINPTMMYTMFSVFAEDSPQQVRKNMVQWISNNKKQFEKQTLLTFTAKDSELDAEHPETALQTKQELTDVTSQPQDVEFPIAATNLIVALPPDIQLNLDYEPQARTLALQTTPCSMKLYRCDIEPTESRPSVPIDVNVVVKHPNCDLRTRNCNKCNTTTSTCR